MTAGVFYTGLPFDGGDRIVLVQDYDRTAGHAVDVGADEFLHRRESLKSFEYLTAFLQRFVTLGEDTSGTSVARALYSSYDFLHVTGASPMLGRLPDQDDTRPGAAPVVVLPHSAWVRLMASDPRAVGAQIAIGGVPHTVLGIMPADFGFPWSDDLWIPFDVREADAPLRIVGKIRPGIDLRTARAELTAIARPDPTQVSPTRT